MQAFISYEYLQNQDFVAGLAAQLKEHKITPFTNDLQLALESHGLYEGIDRALRDCDFAIAVLTKAYVDSDWLHKELNALYSKEKSMRTPYLLPLLVEDCEVPRYLDKEKICDLRNVQPADVYESIRPFIAQTRQVFVVMKFGDEDLNSTYELAMKPVIEQFSHSAMRVDQIETSEPITPRILSEIRRSAIVLSDLTGRRPNCYYETGYAHALDKEIILTIREGEAIDFDLKVHQFIIWKTPADLKEALQRRFEAIRKRQPHDD